ncbi:MAG: acyl-CoA dehydratase activase-related protein [Candidatus Ancillula sp.]|jgi:activator of 2-hydroxyglutaryl-CoA dehydratase/predicted nucleotide-binding protein (sugar kinase/HSP70/actin superfamily)|nr:acyl-CoA dehydratase activase-related protein [Candidatus Ancillula sp.]
MADGKEFIFNLGLDVGSTTVKVVALEDGINQDTIEENQTPRIVFSHYKRHHANIKTSILEILQNTAESLAAKYGSDIASRVRIRAALTGSAGMGIADSVGIKFVQEVIAETEAINRYNPDTDVIVELGGEDAKITYLKPTPEQRMNGTCAGGTGAFIDQMAILLKTDATGLNRLAQNYNELYPIASRCGVFAKTDLQPLINDGVPSEDLAASIFQAVATQTIAGLACGRAIRGKVVFLGGPLYFLPELREAFRRALKENVDEFTTPENAQLYVALGAALLAGKTITTPNEQLPTLQELISSLEKFSNKKSAETKRMRPLFKNVAEFEKFKKRHEEANVEILDLSAARGPLFLGLDAGSTTIKAVLIDEQDKIYYSFYSSNDADPVLKARSIVREILDKLPENAYIAQAFTTGYGEGLIKTALNLDGSEVETVAHYTAAEHFLPGVTSIIDIGGQDMKYLSIARDSLGLGTIDSIAVNEACSSGCGSFLQTFATTMQKDIKEFAKLALEGPNPVDLGSRCTVFMNSSVKQAQKEGATISDISAGLAYSVIRNALYKVIKLRDTATLGTKVIVQGGTFLNDAVLRAFELLADIEVVRLNISGLMGAFGAAKLAKQQFEITKTTTTMLNSEQLDSLTLDTQLQFCSICPNRCKLTVTSFSSGAKFVSGNRCEKGAAAYQTSVDDGQITKEPLPNLYQYKYDRTFDRKYYKPLTQREAKKQGIQYRGKIGIPRALNMYENYPFWFTILSELGFEVKLSARSSHKLFEKGMESIVAENICYPAKLVHGAVVDLIDSGIKRIFYPCITFEVDETPDADNNYNCPIVANYPQVIVNNVEQLYGNRVQKGQDKTAQIDFIYPYFSLKHKQHTAKRVWEEFKRFGISLEDAKRAVEKGYAEDNKFKLDIYAEGERVWKYAQENNIPVIVLAGRPYHLDPEINHGIPEAISLLGQVVMTEDIASALFDKGVANGQLEDLKRPLRVMDQWMYHSRLYKAAAFVGQNDLVSIVQLVSFGCGLDAVTSDQVMEILRHFGDTFTLLKIDEVSNLGAAKIRLRSLLAARKARLEKINSKKQQDEKNNDNNNTYGKKNQLFTKQMKETHTILCPQMSPMHFRLVQSVFTRTKYNLKILEKVTEEDIEVGLKYVNNDMCFPAIMVIGQLINALQSGKYDLGRTSVIMSQTGGMCRATNYISMLRMGLKMAGFGDIAVLSISTSGLEKHPGFKLGISQLIWAMRALVLGDVLQDVVLRTRPYEKQLGEVDELYEKWNNRICSWIEGSSRGNYKKMVNEIVDDFTKLELQDIPRKKRVGVVGEILVKFHPDANNNVIDVIEEQGCEAVLPGIFAFMTNKLYIAKWNWDNIKRGSRRAVVGKKLAGILAETFTKPVNKAYRKSGRFDLWPRMQEVVDYASTVTSIGVQAGEGWLLAGEIVELIHRGVPNIVCANPFACLPNHVTGRGIFQEIRRQYSNANIVSVDYDPGASKVNQLNRIKLMISAASE